MSDIHDLSHRHKEIITPVDFPRWQNHVVTYLGVGAPTLALSLAILPRFYDERLDGVVASVESLIEALTSNIDKKTLFLVKQIAQSIEEHENSTSDSQDSRATGSQTEPEQPDQPKAMPAAGEPTRPKLVESAISELPPPFPMPAELDGLLSFLPRSHALFGEILWGTDIYSHWSSIQNSPWTYTPKVQPPQLQPDQRFIRLIFSSDMFV